MGPATPQRCHESNLTHTHTNTHTITRAGDSGIIRTLDTPLYVVRAAAGAVTALDRDGRVRTLGIEPAEYGFKLALMQVRVCVCVCVCVCV